MHIILQRATKVAALFFASIALSALFAASAYAQSATVSGTVTDPTGAAVPGAAVTLQNTVSGYSRKSTSDSAGHY